MTQSLICLDAPEIDRELDRLARQMRQAENVGVRLISTLGRPADRALARLPQSARAPVEEAVMLALGRAMDVAAASRGLLGDHRGWVTAATAGAAGAVGGFGGAAVAMAEVPVSITVMMRGVQAVAARHGHDPSEEQTRKDCLLAFAAAGPLQQGRGGDLNFLASRMTLSGRTLQSAIGLVAPQLPMGIGRKLAARAVPVLGAATGAARNRRDA